MLRSTTAVTAGLTYVPKTVLLEKVDGGAGGEHADEAVDEIQHDEQHGGTAASLPRPAPERDAHLAAIGRPRCRRCATPSHASARTQPRRGSRDQPDIAGEQQQAPEQRADSRPPTRDAPGTWHGCLSAPIRCVTLRASCSAACTRARLDLIARLARAAAPAAHGRYLQWSPAPAPAHAAPATGAACRHRASTATPASVAPTWNPDEQALDAQQRALDGRRIVGALPAHRDACQRLLRARPARDR